MAYKHGIYGSENPTSLIPPVESGNTVVAIGTANSDSLNEPVLCTTYKEYVETFGVTNDKDFTLNEVAEVFFSLYGVGPVIFINVLDKSTHNTTVAAADVTLTAGEYLLEDTKAIIGDIVIKLKGGTGSALVVDTDYVAIKDNDGNINITAITGGALDGEAEMNLEYKQVDPSAVDSQDIIGGVGADLKSTGLELVGSIFHLFRMVPNMLIAPKYSKDPAVAAIMDTKISDIGGTFRGYSFVDIPSDKATIANYTKVAEWKNTNNYVQPNQFATWPKVSLGDTDYWYSTHQAALCCLIDNQNGSIPSESPSNKNLKIDGLKDEEGEVVELTKEQANILNGNGVVTAINFIGGWVSWGNRTSCYPGNTDPKDAFISIKRMMIWNHNRFIQTYWKKLDATMTRRNANTIIDSERAVYSGMINSEQIIDGNIEFRASDNPITSLIDGINSFFITFTPGPPMREINFTQEFNPYALESLLQ